MNEEKLLKTMRVKMEEYGMPEFKDDYPAMDILQLVKDAGYTRAEQKLVPIDKVVLHNLICGDVPHSIDDCEQANAIVETIYAKFGTPQKTVDEILAKMPPQESTPLDMRAYAQKVHTLIYGNQGGNDG